MKPLYIAIILFFCCSSPSVLCAEVLSIDSIHSKAIECFKKEEHERALQYLIECSELIRKQYGESSPQYHEIMSECGYCCVNLDRYEDAISYELIAYNITKSTPKEHVNHVKSLIDYYGEIGDYESVRIYLKELLPLFNIVYEKADDLADALFEASGYYKALNDFNGEEALIRRAISIDNDNELNTIRQFSLFECLIKSRKYEEAIYEGKTNLSKWEKHFEPTDSSYVICGVISTMLAECYGESCDYLSAIGFNERAIDIFENTVGRYDIRTAMSYNSLADYYSNIWQYRKAIDYENQAIEILTQITGTENIKYAISLSNLAYYYRQIGMNVEAVNLCEQALSIHEGLEVSDDYDYLLITSNLADHFATIGNYDRAIELTQIVLNIRRVSKNEFPLEYATSLNNMATYISHSDNSSEMSQAISFQKEAIRILADISTENNRDYLDGLRNLAQLYIDVSDYDKALEILNKCVFLSEGQGNFNKSLLYYNIANVYYCLKEYDRAIEYLNDARAIMISFGQTNMVEYTNVLVGLYYACLQKGDNDGIMKWIKEIEETNYNLVVTHLPFLSSHERSRYWKLLSDWYHVDLPLSLKVLDNEHISGILYNSMLFSKGMLLGTDIEVERLLNDSVINHIMQERLMVEKFTSDKDSLNRLIDQKERMLLMNSGIGPQIRQYYSVKHQDISNCLNADEIAIEFLMADGDGESSCFALCLKRDYDNPHIIKLSDTAQLSDQTNDNISLSEIAKLIWNPLQEELSNVRTIYFAPDGILNILPIEYALYPNEERMSDLYDIFRVSSTRELINLNESTQIQSAVIYGGLNYDESIDDLYASNRSLGISQTILGNKERSIRASMSLAECLLGSIDEVESIYKLSQDYIKTSLYTSNAGTEESFKSLSSKPIDVLHLSTHGFFWKNDKDLSNPYLKRLSDKYKDYEDKALTRSGLYLSGVNNYLREDYVPSDLDDGVLTANEIVKLDFSNLDLVVMSACQSGLGTLERDGVYGLQRAFKKAGAKSLLMSLWKVDDFATKLLMVEFYRNFLSGKGKQESLRIAQLYMRNFEDENGNRIFESPYYWAGFILLDALN